jgi:RimJ/RimL family protein N-acetyltransferase
MSSGPVIGEAQMRRHIAQAWEQERNGHELPFAVILCDTGRAIGSTRFLDLRPAHRGIEIGSTWYATAYQRTAVNSECKLLLLQHAFESLDCIRVQLKTDARNLRSQQAIERLGAVKEGTLRNHMILPGGDIRTTVLYSITAQEWPTVKARLQANLAPAT